MCFLRITYIIKESEKKKQNERKKEKPTMTKLITFLSFLMSSLAGLNKLRI